MSNPTSMKHSQTDARSIFIPYSSVCLIVSSPECNNTSPVNLLSVFYSLVDLSLILVFRGSLSSIHTYWCIIMVMMSNYMGIGILRFYLNTCCSLNHGGNGPCLLITPGGGGLPLHTKSEEPHFKLSLSESYFSLHFRWADGIIVCEYMHVM